MPGVGSQGHCGAVGIVNTTMGALDQDLFAPISSGAQPMRFGRVVVLLSWRGPQSRPKASAPQSARGSLASRR
jgi:hypothetical protein